VAGATGTAIGGSVLAANAAAGSGLMLTGGSAGLSLTTTTILAGPRLGHLSRRYNSGAIALSSVSVQGAAYGIS